MLLRQLAEVLKASLQDRRHPFPILAVVGAPSLIQVSWNHLAVFVILLLSFVAEWV